MKTKSLNISEHLINACMEILPCLPEDARSSEEETVINSILFHVLVNAGYEYPVRQAMIFPYLKAFAEEKFKKNRKRDEKVYNLIENLFGECKQPKMDTEE